MPDSFEAGYGSDGADYLFLVRDYLVLRQSRGKTKRLEKRTMLKYSQGGIVSLFLHCYGDCTNNKLKNSTEGCS